MSARIWRICVDSAESFACGLLRIKQTPWHPKDLAQSLDLIAQERTNTVRPRTRLLVDGEKILNAMVLKRTHSNTGEHVIVASDTHRCNWDYLRCQLGVPGSQWMAQSFVELLVRLGEWRVFLIGGRVVYTVHTLKNWEHNTWSWDMTHTFYMLEELG